MFSWGHGCKKKASFQYLQCDKDSKWVASFKYSVSTNVSFGETSRLFTKTVDEFGAENSACDVHKSPFYMSLPFLFPKNPLYFTVHMRAQT